MPSANPQEWSREDVAAWLRAAGLPRLVALFGAVDGRALLALDDAKLIALGVRNKTVRQKLLVLIANLSRIAEDSKRDERKQTRPVETGKVSTVEDQMGDMLDKLLSGDERLENQYQYLDEPEPVAEHAWLDEDGGGTLDSSDSFLKAAREAAKEEKELEQRREDLGKKDEKEKQMEENDAPAQEIEYHMAGLIDDSRKSRSRSKPTKSTKSTKESEVLRGTKEPPKGAARSAKPTPASPEVQSVQSRVSSIEARSEVKPVAAKPVAAKKKGGLRIGRLFGSLFGSSSSKRSEAAPAAIGPTTSSNSRPLSERDLGGKQEPQEPPKDEETAGRGGGGVARGRGRGGLSDQIRLSGRLRKSDAPPAPAVDAKSAAAAAAPGAAPPPFAGEREKDKSRRTKAATGSKVSGAQKQTDKVDDVVRSNIDKLVERGEILDDLHEKSEQLKGEALRFKKKKKPAAPARIADALAARLKSAEESGDESAGTEDDQDQEETEDAWAAPLAEGEGGEAAAAAPRRGKSAEEKTYAGLDALLGALGPQQLQQQPQQQQQQRQSSFEGTKDTASAVIGDLEPLYSGARFLGDLPPPPPPSAQSQPVATLPPSFALAAPAPVATSAAEPYAAREEERKDKERERDRDQDEDSGRDETRLSEARVRNDARRKLEEERQVDAVHFSAFAPPAVQPDTDFLLYVWAYVKEERERMLEMASEGGAKTEAGKKGPVKLARGTEVTVILKLPKGFTADEEEDSLVWEGDVSSACFDVHCDSSTKPGQHSCKALIQVEGATLATLRFQVKVDTEGAVSHHYQSAQEVAAGSGDASSDSSASTELQTSAVYYNRIFACFAEEDEMDVYQWKLDVETSDPNLIFDMDCVRMRRSSAVWESALKDPKFWRKYDLVMVFWSSNASTDSKVETEWNSALKAMQGGHSSGEDFLQVVLLQPAVLERHSLPAVLQSFHRQELPRQFVVRPAATSQGTTEDPLMDSLKSLNDMLPSGAEATNMTFMGVNDLILGPVIGRGAFGVVHKAVWRGSHVVAKRVPLEGVSKEQTREALLEAVVMKRVGNHPNVVRFCGVCLAGKSDNRELLIVSEFVERGSLLQYMTKDNGSVWKTVPWPTKIQIARGAASGLWHLHQERVIHRDFAARNLLLDKNLNVKVTDFGMSRFNQQEDLDSVSHTKQAIGPVKWMAPESLKQRQYSTASDVWSLGVVLWEILTAKEPYPGLTPLEAAHKVVNEHVTLCHPKYMPSDTPKRWEEIMTICFNWMPTARPSCQTVAKLLGDYLALVESGAEEGGTEGGTAPETDGGDSEGIAKAAAIYDKARQQETQTSPSDYETYVPM